MLQPRPAPGCAGFRPFSVSPRLRRLRMGPRTRRQQPGLSAAGQLSSLRPASETDGVSCLRCPETQHKRRGWDSTHERACGPQRISSAQSISRESSCQTRSWLSSPFGRSILRSSAMNPALVSCGYDPGDVSESERNPPVEPPTIRGAMREVRPRRRDASAPTWRARQKSQGDATTALRATKQRCGWLPIETLSLFGLIPLGDPLVRASALFDECSCAFVVSCDSIPTKHCTRTCPAKAWGNPAR